MSIKIRQISIQNYQHIFIQFRLAYYLNIVQFHQQKCFTLDNINSINKCIYNQIQTIMYQQKQLIKYQLISIGIVVITITIKNSVCMNYNKNQKFSFYIFVNFAIIIIIYNIQTNRHNFIMQQNILNEFKRDRLFGKQITNVIESKGFKNDNRITVLNRKQNNISVDVVKRNNTKIAKVYESKNKTIVLKKPQIKEKNILEDVQYVPQYFQQNLRFMLSEQSKSQLLYNYFPFQKDLNESMRIILLDWILQVHQKFRMFPHTLFITCNIIDRYLLKKQISRSKLQLVGATALFIAAKYEQTYQVPQLQDMISLCAKTYSKNQFLEMESSILKILDFKLIVDSSYKFYQPFATLDNFDQKKFSLGRYILQASLFDIKMLKYKPSMIAAATILLCNKINLQKEAWSDRLMAATGYEQCQLLGCKKQLVSLLQGINELIQVKNLKKKFSNPCFYEVAIKTKFNQEIC